MTEYFGTLYIVFYDQLIILHLLHDLLEHELDQTVTIVLFTDESEVVNLALLILLDLNLQEAPGIKDSLHL